MRRFPLSLLLPLLVSLLCLAAAVSLVGCGSSGDDSVPGLVPVNITLNNSQDVTEVTIFHFDGSQWNPVFSQNYQNQATIPITVDLITGDQYRVETYATDSNGNLVPLSQREFTAGAGDNSFGDAARSVHPAQQIVIEVPQVRRPSVPAAR